MDDNELLEEIAEEERTRLREIEIRKTPNAFERGLLEIRVKSEGMTQTVKLNPRELLDLIVQGDRFLQDLANTTATAAYVMATKHPHCPTCNEMGERALLEARLTNVMQVQEGNLSFLSPEESALHGAYAERMTQKGN